MELAATALAQAVGSSGGQGGGEDSESSEDEGDGATLASPSHGINHANSQTTKLSVSLRMKKGKKFRGRKQDSGGVSATSSGVTIDALVGVLQDPDRGVPRALETRLKDVKIRRGRTTIIIPNFNFVSELEISLTVQQMWVPCSLGQT